LNSETSKNKDREKKQSRKKLREKKLKLINENHEEPKKSDIFSKLETIDDIRKEKSRVVEEKLKNGLIKIEQTEKGEEEGKDKLSVSEIKKEIATLQSLKLKKNSEGEYEKAIKISKKIIVLAFSNKLKSLVKEENKFIEATKRNIIQEPTEQKNIEVIKEDFVSQNLIREQKNLDPKKTEVQEESNLKEDITNINKEKVDLEQEKLKFEEERKAFEWEKQMMLEVKNFERDKVETDVENNIDDIIQEKVEEEIEKLSKEKILLKEQKDEFEKKKREFEEKAELLKQERIMFEEEKEAFKWEKEMFEEIKKHEREKTDDIKD
jgi:hypothetical protein